MSQSTITQTATDVIVCDPSPVHVRPYDFNLGDERSFLREEAIAKAHRRVKDRGCRQQVRKVAVVPNNAHVIPSWLIQDI